nr:MAG TPA: restriction alleviation protein [Caudoviricetes sp.]
MLRRRCALTGLSKTECKFVPTVVKSIHGMISVLRIVIAAARRWMGVQTMVELKPCPFCGGKATVQGKHTEIYDVWANHPVLCAKYRVGCEKCGIYFWQLHEIQLTDGQPAVIKNGYDEAAEAWNRRADNA